MVPIVVPVTEYGGFMESCIMQRRLEDLTQYIFALELDSGKPPTEALDRARAVAGALIHHFTDEAMIARGLVLEDRDGRQGTVLH
jgi:hypothetical protein